ncbi:DUF4142 domain-containing protein [Pusillimonas sp.]|uniref:DUF4142 domain-containing protein n=1 Tax=Pusillimonas sp. TaxID=3040095 RepID=UPI0029A50D88|nr:DUF4142 domain-containing protein [Pusillimonas sp.]MDX3894652.1 DUF4142 domain-containing protein [Pusillimonas sp.]
MAGLGAHAQSTQQGPATSPSQPAPGAAAPTQSGAAANENRDRSELNDEDQRFLENAIQGSYAEIEGSKLALEKTENQEVKDFAQMMIEDHGKMLEEAQGLARNKKLTPPTEPSVMQRTEVTGMKALTGGAFDAMYVNRIGVASHESTVEMFEKASREAQDPDVKAMASKTLPKLQEHLKAARALNERQDKQ